MRGHYCFVVAALVSLSTPPAGAQVAASAEAPVAKKRCEYFVPTGGRIARKTCYSAKEWERKAEANRQAALDLMNRPVVSETRGN